MTYHTLALGTLVYEKQSHHNTYPKIQESYETTYTYPTLKIQNLCNINTLTFYISNKFSKTRPPLYALYNIPLQHWLLPTAHMLLLVCSPLRC
jgi:hypothetical protein